jgi:peptide/nickel transport system permease protein
VSRTDRDTATDGGLAKDEQSDFEVTADVPLTPRERYKQAIDEYLLTPLRILWTDLRARIAVVIISVYVLMGAIAWMSAAGVWVLVPEPSPSQAPILIGVAENMAHPLGTTYDGQSILSQVVHATPPILKMTFAGAVFATTVATVIGTVSGYKGGAVDQVLMTVTDIALTIPGLPLVIVLAGSLSGSLSSNPFVIGLLLTINAWAGLARMIRSQVLTLRDAEYVEASRVMDISLSKIIIGDITPNLMPYIAMNFVQTARGVIFGSVALYYLGILPYSNINWGVMMEQAVSRAGATTSAEAVHWLLVPLIAVIGFALGLTLFAQAADRLFNPRVRARHAESIKSEGDDETTTEL